MQFIDLTHSMHEGMPVYPGTEPPSIIETNTLSEHGFREKKVTFCSHTGSHVDAPAHILAEGRTLDEFPISQFHGPAVVYGHKPQAEIIGVSQLQSVEKELVDADFLLIATGWDKYWGKEEYFKSFPVLSIEAAHWLKQFQLKGIGLDVISADSIESVELAVHCQLLSHDILIFENLKNLNQIPATLCTFTALPLKLSGGDGAPVRAFVAV